MHGIVLSSFRDHPPSGEIQLYNELKIHSFPNHSLGMRNTQAAHNVASFPDFPAPAFKNCK